MKKLVVESLDEFIFEAKKAEEKEDKAKPENIGNVKAKMEKTKATKLKEKPEDKATQAIKALKEEIAKAKKPGSFKTVSQKNAKIAELEAKVKAWEKKAKK